jgi:SagB-type dehydrogenase family enzyme
MKKTLLWTAALILALFFIGVFSRYAHLIAERAEEPVKSKEKTLMKEIILPPARNTGQMPLETAIQKRQSVRKYAPKELTLDQAGQILWAAYGVNPRKNNFISRNVPSAGGIFPMTVYLLDKNGIYRYQPLSHSLGLVKAGDKRAELAAAAFGQGAVKQAPVNLVITADEAKCAQRYGERARRYTDMEAGHIGQNVSLQAVALGLSTVMVGAFNDEAVRELIALPDNEAPLYIIPVGYGLE